MRKLILNAAKRLLKKEPKHQLSITKIAKEAKVSRQSVYRYFNNKEELIEILSKEKIIDNKEDLDIKTQIINSAYQTFAQLGYNQATLDNIADKAGMTKGAIYSHFNSKEDLFVSIFNHHIEDQVSFVLEEIKTALSSANQEKQLNDVIQKQLDAIETNSEWSKLLLEFFAHSKNPEIKTQLTQSYRHFKQELTEIFYQLQESGYISPDIYPGMIATVIPALLDGLIMHWIVYSDQTKPISSASQLSKILWNGISPK